MASLADFLFPPRCARCDRVVPISTVFCEGCIAALTASLGKACPVCGKPVDCCCPEQLSFAFRRSIAVFPYDNTAEPLLVQLKKDAHSPALPVIAGWMAERVQQEYRDIRFSAVVPVPMAEEQQKRRGHNHAETLSALLAAILGLPLCTNLLLQQETGQAQHTLSRKERFDHAAACYQSTGQPTKGNLLLVDDIFTTGATLDACARLLLSQGADTVYGVTAAATSQPSNGTTKEKHYGFQ